MKTLTTFIIAIFVICVSCSDLDSETQSKFKANKEIIEQYAEQLGYANNPFLAIIPDERLDSQRKKYIASLSEQQLKNLVLNSTSGVPKIESGTKRSKAFLKEVRGIKDQAKKYDILVDKYPDIILE